MLCNSVGAFCSREMSSSAKIGEEAPPEVWVPSFQGLEVFLMCVRENLVGLGAYQVPRGWFPAGSGG
jgi:hypothetical protein